MINSIDWKQNTPKKILSSLKKEQSRILRKINHIVKNKSITFDNVILELEDLQSELNNLICRLNVHSLCFNVKENEPFLKEADQIKELIVNKILLNINLFKKVTYLSTQRDNLKLTKFENKLLNSWMNSFIQKGILLDTKSKNRIIRLEKDVNTLKRKFNSNIIQESKKRLLLDISEVGGLEAADYLKFKKKGNTISIQNDDSICSLFYTYCTNPETREKVWQFSNSKGIKNNKEICQKIINKRHEISILKGFNSHAELTLNSSRMLNSVDNVKSIIMDINSSLSKKVNNEIKLFQSYAKKDKLAEIKESDFDYLQTKIQEDNKIDIESFRHYFPLYQVVNGFFESVGKKMNLSFRKTKISTWHKDVFSYKVFHEGIFLGSLCFDLFARTDKLSGAWCLNVQQKTDKYNKIVGVFMNIDKEEQSNLSISEIQTFFHEMGHAIHALFSEDLTPSFNSEVFEWDAIEVPSLALEQLVFEDWVLPHISICPPNKKPISKYTIKKIIKSRNLGNAISIRKSLGLAFLDISIHSGQVKSSLLTLEDKFFSPFQTFKKVKKTSALTSLDHIFTETYHASYYSYIWSEVLSSDIYSHWKKQKFSEKVFTNYIQTVLMPGADVSASKKITNFLNRDFNNDAWVEQNCLHKD